MPTLTLLLLLLSGAARADATQARPIESYAARATVGGVTVAAEPYGSEKISDAFDVHDLAKRGYFPLYIAIRNQTQDYVSISTRKVILLTSSGQPLYTTSAALLVDDVTRGGGFKGKGGSSVLDALTARELRNGQIEPGETVEGLVFFFTTAPRKDFFAGAKLTVPGLTNRTTGRDIGPFEIPLPAGGADPKP